MLPLQCGPLPMQAEAGIIKATPLTISAGTSQLMT